MDVDSGHEVPWRTSTFCAISDCVAVRRRGYGAIEVRNTGDPEGHVLMLGPADMADWLRRIKAGAFDELV